MNNNLFGLNIGGQANPIMQGIYDTAKGALNNAVGGQKLWSGNPLGNLIGVAHAAELNPLDTSSNPFNATPTSQNPTGYSGPQLTPIPTNNTTNNNVPTGGLIQQTQPTQPTQQNNNNDPYATYKNEISTAWDNYLNSIGGIQNDLTTQNDAQTNIVNDQLTQGQNKINSQKAQSLKDIANTTRNAFQAGNNYLGSLGAGDSSAANQYSFAINQQAQKQTGALNNFVNDQLNTLQSQHDTQLNQIANWFSQQQQALKQALASGQLQKGQDLASLSMNILNQALSAKQQLQNEASSRYNALLQWAANNSSNISQLQGNINNISKTFAPGQLSTFGQAQTPIQYGGTANTKTDIFGNPIQ